MGKVRRVDWSPAEWLSGTRGILTQRETGVYDCVLNMIYDRGGECPNDAAFVAGHFKPEAGDHGRNAAWHVRQTRAALDQLVALGKLRATPDGQWLTNGRADAELGKAHGRIDDAARAGRASGAARRRNKITSRGPAVGQPWGSHGAAVGDSKSSNDKGLARTPVSYHQPPTKNQISDSESVAARDPSPSRLLRAARKSKTQERVEQLARERRAKLLKGDE